ncbi:hypothetical protein RAS1_20740 [Phycisphaerae bacterium RAS1]|nr:hypothetical protein RAS1_20740 [Phycisphaerae bacterium RAS1]
MDHDTDIGGPAGRFPATRASAVRAAAGGDPEARRRAIDVLIAGYWKPVYKYIRFKWHAGNEEAKDLTQGFFAHAVEKEIFGRYDAGKAALRTFLMACIDAFVSNERKAARRLKRGGDVQLVSLDFADAEREYQHHPAARDGDVTAYFEQEWVRGLFEVGLAELRRHCESLGKSVQFSLFERYDVLAADAPAAPSYAQLAEEFDLPVTQVTNYLSWARREFRRIVLEKLYDMSGDDVEFRSEARRLLGVDPE